MNFGGPSFVIAIVTICTLGWIVNNWIRAKHGYPLENEWSGVSHKTDPAAVQQIEQLTSENAGLKSQIGRMEERLAVLERIGPDPATRTAHEIESLR